jgi:hypothetical protein
VSTPKIEGGGNRERLLRFASRFPGRVEWLMGSHGVLGRVGGSDSRPVQQTDLSRF